MNVLNYDKSFKSSHFQNCWLYTLELLILPEQTIDIADTRAENFAKQILVDHLENTYFSKPSGGNVYAESSFYLSNNSYAVSSIKYKLAKDVEPNPRCVLETWIDRCSPTTIYSLKLSSIIRSTESIFYLAIKQMFDLEKIYDANYYSLFNSILNNRLKIIEVTNDGK
jgi:hypothetical protein